MAAMLVAELSMDQQDPRTTCTDTRSPTPAPERLRVRALRPRHQGGVAPAASANRAFPLAAAVRRVDGLSCESIGVHSREDMNEMSDANGE